MSASEHNDDDRRRLAEAAAWRVRLTEMGVETSDGLQEWLAADLRNEAAWQTVQAAWTSFDGNAAAPDLIDARQAALRDARRQAAKQWRKRGLTQTLTVTAAAVLLVCAGLWGGLAWLGEPALYETALGERRVVTLEDGSRISLDSESAVEVAYRERSRDLRLVRGQARFDVAHDVERPFSVMARGQKVVATGTAFNVDLTGGAVRVTLIEGRVVVLDERTQRADELLKPQPVELVAGQQLAVTSGARAIEAASLEKTGAWERGQLVFENETLASIVSRVSRYSRRRVVVGDANAGALRISGVFNTGDVNGFVDTVTRYLPVTAKAQGDNIELHSKR